MPQPITSTRPRRMKAQESDIFISHAPCNCTQQHGYILDFRGIRSVEAGLGSSRENFERQPGALSRGAGKRRVSDLPEPDRKRPKQPYTG